MTTNPSAARKPYDHAGYSALRGDAPSAEAPKTDTPAQPKATGEFTKEAERLLALREALWGAFEAGPDAGLPDTLIDLTMAYTGSLRLQLSLRSIAWRQSMPRPRGTPRPDPPFKTRGDGP